MNIMKTLVSKVALQTYFFILGLVLFNLGIYLFSLDLGLGLIASGLTLVLVGVIINSEKKGGK